MPTGNGDSELFFPDSSSERNVGSESLHSCCLSFGPLPQFFVIRLAIHDLPEYGQDPMIEIRKI